MMLQHHFGLGSQQWFITPPAATALLEAMLQHGP
jgi:hypothetical protein